MNNDLSKIFLAIFSYCDDMARYESEFLFQCQDKKKTTRRLGDFKEVLSN